ncbi:NADH dehydrogenase [ubiquinone] 1 subunit C2 [Protopterus annectens]|uniref:NADH dehydrogenase [ubiquinone] 1 subunit C2 n=1 Tax=Protopterus annectens TaxID=7888 RepID=UPI001CFAFC7B|nr:NADH dehydrogenase [ubiquinone] 1 subunit C2 [Protopterus annectens]
MGLLPDKAKVLPPPAIANRNSVWLGFLGWLTAILDNALNRRPPLAAGVHRQALWITAGVFVGYHLTKMENYKYAKRDQEMLEYIRLHPEDFPEKEKRTFAEILQDFIPVR